MRDPQSRIGLDMVWLQMAGLVVMLLLLISYIAKPDAEEIKHQGELMVEIFWADEKPVDVDLWILAPNDSPVGYPRKNGRVFDLRRDDIGGSDDLSGRNYEVAFSRALPDGLYIFNLVLFRSNAEYLPVKVRMVISLKVPGDKMRQKYAKDVTLFQVKEQITVFSLELRDKRIISDVLIPTTLYR